MARANRLPSFQEQLENLYQESRTATVHVYASLLVQHAASKSHRLLNHLNESPTFWLATGSAHHIAAYMALARMFDQKNSRYNAFRTLEAAESNIDLFSRDALAQRKRGSSAVDPPWLKQYVEDAFVPTQRTFSELREKLERRSAVYRRLVHEARNQYFAHRVEVAPEKVRALYSGGTVNELCRLALFLIRFHDVLQALYNNGRRPVFRPVRYSVQKMFERPPSGSSPEQRVAREILQLMATLDAATMVREIPVEWKGRPQKHQPGRRGRLG